MGNKDHLKNHSFRDDLKGQLGVTV
jgi:hypothetical protein